MARGPDLFELLREGDRTALSRAITLVESTRAGDLGTARSLIDRAMGTGSASVRIGVTGIPGVGKSTLIDALGRAMIARGHRVAVLAIDPSSPRSAGSILGDKTRMERLAADPAAFVRPSPSGGAPGGVARATGEAILLCEAAGFDRVLVETVGVGQGEVAVDRLVDLTLLLMIAGAGDELQGIKRGIMETADLIAIAKADGDNRGRSEQARLDLLGAVRLLPPRENGIRPEVMLCSAVEELGIEELLRAIDERVDADRRGGWFERRRRRQELEQFHAAIAAALMDRFRNAPRVSAELPALEQAVAERRMSPHRAAAELVARYGPE